MSKVIWTVVVVLAVTAGSRAAAAEPEFKAIFAGRDGCFELYDLAANKVIVRSDAAQCARRTTPASTFKVPLALMAFDAGILQDENSFMKWDGTHYPRDPWNQDQTATTWMQNSVVWYSQRLTPKLGMAKVKDYLARFDYGNRDMSGGLTRAWLSSSLQISPDEQVRFWVKFWREELPVSKHAFAMTKKITFVDTSPAGWVLNGKTGSGDVTGKPTLWIGWYVGHVEREGKQYVFVTRYVDVRPSPDERPSGFIAREMSKTILAQLGLY
ncbi:MAG TPA: penicillin-binding transpeptidase domain-containing protein [Candidatus Polarisedimenticolaceae bacterium]|nr:penicillin-binding transpeptidase domain-containing protein [Candidatus Polarisedimenticolaceae bacterium]